MKSEPERVVPFAERAHSEVERLKGAADALELLTGDRRAWIVVTLRRGASLLQEAEVRGVKGKEFGGL
jgi:hypothetical protein